MKNTPFILFLTLCFNAFGQQYTDSTITKDFNSDGVADTLNYFEEYGTGFGGIEYKITNGKTKEVFELSNFSSYGSVKKLIRIPPTLLKKENKGFLDAFKKGLLPTKRNTADASLQWIIDATHNSYKLKDCRYFDKVFTPNTQWVTTAYEPPSTYYIELEGDPIIKLDDVYSETDVINNKNHKAFLLYWGKNIRDWELRVDHEGNSEDGPITVATNEDYKIYKTKHAILAKKGNAYKWLFITDSDITDAPEKLRWASIDKIILKGDYLIFKQNLPPDPEYNVYIIHIESGNFGRLNINFDEILKEDIFVSDLSKEEELSIKSDTIVIGRGKRSLRIPFNEIKRNLDSFSKQE